MANQKNQQTDSANGSAAAGTKQLTQTGNVAVSSKLEDGGASDKGFKAPDKKVGTR